MITVAPSFVIGDTNIAGVQSKETLEQIIKDGLVNKNLKY